VINSPTYIGVLRRIEHLGALGAICRQVNRRILNLQRGRNCAVHDPVFVRAGHTAGRKCRRPNRGPLRYGDPRAMAPMAALTLCLHHVAGFTNKRLRPVVATLLGKPYGASQMSYDLWRLRAKGLIQRLPGHPHVRANHSRDSSGDVLHEDLHQDH
jgi:hypothetical protein